MGFEKTMGGGLTSVVQIILTKECRLVNMSSPNADIIAVSLSCPKNPKNPYRMGPPRACSVRNLFDERYCNSGPIKLWHF